MRISDWSSDVCSSDLRLPVQLSFALQFGDRCTIARRFVGIERGRLFPVLQASQGLAQEPLRCLGAAGRRQVVIDRVAPLVDCPVQVDRKSVVVGKSVVVRVGYGGRRIIKKKKK